MTYLSNRLAKHVVRSVAATSNTPLAIDLTTPVEQIATWVAECTAAVQARAARHDQRLLFTEGEVHAITRMRAKLAWAARAGAPWYTAEAALLRTLWARVADDAVLSLGGWCCSRCNTVFGGSEDDPCPRCALDDL